MRLLWCKHCGGELHYSKQGLVHSATNTWRCRINSAVKTVAGIGRYEDTDDEEAWSGGPQG